jgi:hypothetical protein
MSFGNANTFRPTLTHLEDRLAPATFQATISSTGVLQITGSNASETIKVRHVGSDIIVDGVGKVAAYRVREIRVDAGAGNDRIELNVSPQLAARSTVNGGAGTDLIVYPQGGLPRYIGVEYGSQIRPATSNPSSQTNSGMSGKPAGWYFEAKSGVILPGESTPRPALYGPYATQAQAVQAMNNRIAIAGSSSIVRTPFYYSPTGGSSGSGSAGNTQPSNVINNVKNNLINLYNNILSNAQRVLNYFDQVRNWARPWANLYNQITTVRNEYVRSVNSVLNNIRSGVSAPLNPSVLGYMATQVRNAANNAKNDVNRTIPGELWAPVRQAAYSVLNILYSAANTMDNLGNAIRSAQR